MVFSKDIIGCRLIALAYETGAGDHLKRTEYSPPKDMGICIAICDVENIPHYVCVNNNRQLTYYLSSKYVIEIHPEDYPIFQQKLRARWSNLDHNVEEVERAELLDLEIEDGN